MNYSIRSGLVLLAVLVTLGCKSAEEREAARARKAEAKAAAKAQKEQEAEQQRVTLQAELLAKLPEDSKLRLLTIGMSEAEVGALLGVPTAQRSRLTGKAFNPFNVAGKDTMRTTYYYQGLGRVSFSSGSWGQRNGVIDFEHDANEPGGPAAAAEKDAKD
jgi:hypothetical protein